MAAWLLHNWRRSRRSSGSRRRRRKRKSSTKGSCIRKAADWGSLPLYFSHPLLFFSRLLLLRCRQIGCVKSQCIATPPPPPPQLIVSTRRRGLNVWWLAWPRRSSLRTMAAKVKSSRFYELHKKSSLMAVWFVWVKQTNQTALKVVSWTHWSSNELSEIMTQLPTWKSVV